MRPFRYAIVIGVALLGAHAQGFAGAIMALVIFGVLACAFYTATDAWSSAKQAFSKPRITNEDNSQTLHVHTGESMPGQNIDWPAVVEVGRQTRQKGNYNGGA